MMISTKGKYALLVMEDLAEHYGEGYVPMREICERKGVSLKYLERIFPPLTRSKLVDTMQGKGGGYKLNRDPADYTIWEILEVAEGDLAPVSCLSDDSKLCDRAASCRTQPLWNEYFEMTRKFFTERSLADLLPKREETLDLSREPRYDEKDPKKVGK